METLTHLFSPAFVEAAGWTIIHSLWQGIVVALGLSVLLSVTRRNSAQLRYILSFSALFILLVWSGITFNSAYNYASEKQELREKIMTTPGYVRTLLEDNQTQAGENATVKPAANPVNFNLLKVKAFFQRHFDLICMVWLLGMMILMIRLLGGMVYTRRLRTQQLSPVSDVCLEKMIEMADKLGITRRVSIFKSQLTKMPVTIGTFKPVILLPAALISGLSVKELEAILAHELAHIRRHDYLFNIFQSLVEILFFYQPAVWIISNHIRAEREHSCDNLAVELTGDKVTYAKALAAVEIMSLEDANFAMAFSGKNGSLLNRIQRLQTNTTMKTNFMEGVIASGVIILGLLLASFTFDSYGGATKAQLVRNSRNNSNHITASQKDSLRTVMEKSLKELESNEVNKEEVIKLVDVALSEENPERMEEIASEINAALSEVDFENLIHDVLKVTTEAFNEVAKGLQEAKGEIRDENINKDMREAAREIQQACREMEVEMRRDMRKDGINEELIDATVKAASSGMDIASEVVENIDLEGIISGVFTGVSEVLNSIDTTGNRNVCSKSKRNDSSLYLIATTDKDPEVRKLAVSNMTFGPSLTNIAKTDKDPEVRKMAVSRMTFGPSLTNIAKTDKDPEVRKLAISRITFGPSLTTIARTDKDPEVRKFAIERLSQLK